MASDNYTHLFLNDRRKITASKTLKDFESMLEDYQFVRIHQSHLVNLEHIRKYIKTDGGSVIMENGDILPVSRAKKDTFLQKMGLL
jgi:two-component system LytT family response regulator